jgi:hypothetical protein
MGRPQQPELARSGKTDLDPGPVPPENQPGHHPPEESDKPDLDAFAAKLGAGSAPRSRQEAAMELARGGLHFTARTLGFTGRTLGFTGRTLGRMAGRLATAARGSRAR